MSEERDIHLGFVSLGLGRRMMKIVVALALLSMASSRPAQTATTQQDFLYLSFRDYVEADKRCPENATCMLPGTLDALVELWKQQERIEAKLDQVMSMLSGVEGLAFNEVFDDWCSELAAKYGDMQICEFWGFPSGTAFAEGQR